MRRLMAAAAAMASAVLLPIGITPLAEAKEVDCTTAGYDRKIDLGDLAPDMPYRIPSTSRGARLLFVLPLRARKVDLKETVKRPRLAEDVTAVLEFAGIEKEVPEDEAPKPRCVLHVQEYRRSVISLDITFEDDSHLVRRMIAGPDEHLYLSADLPITKIKQVTYDPASGKAQEKERPASFYFGLNAKIGDIYTEYSGREFYKNLSVKALVQASSRPSSSVGIGLSYPTPWFDAFAGYVWTKDSGDVSGKDPGSTQALVVGLSVKVAKGLQWLKNGN